MREALRNKLDLARQTLTEDPDGLLAGKIPAGKRLSHSSGLPSLLVDLIAETDGPRFGGVDLWSAEELGEKQFLCDGLPGGRQQWLCIGQVLYDPLVVSREDSEGSRVRLFRSGPPLDEEGVELGTIDEFLDYFVLGPGYQELVPVDQEENWKVLLDELGLD